MSQRICRNVGIGTRDASVIGLRTGASRGKVLGSKEFVVPSAIVTYTLYVYTC
jgi:hypothetical protein